MTRILLIVSGAVWIAGCAAPSQWQANQDGADPLGPHRYQASAASALAFDAPVMAAYPLPGLDRADREPSAFVGYEDTITEYFSIGMEDHQSDGCYLNGYDRWAYSEKTGVRYK